jgi:hypothetical protein
LLLFDVAVKYIYNMRRLDPLDKVSERLYDFAQDTLDDLDIMPSREQQAEHLSRAFNYVIDLAMETAGEFLKGIFDEKL